MSIFDKQPKFVAATCPKCGGVLELDANFEVAYCSECGRAFCPLFGIFKLTKK